MLVVSCFQTINDRTTGPDNASMVAPDDVRAVAEDEGIPIYVISTNDVNKDPMSSAVFRRISTRTGGKAYFARNWRDEHRAFASIRDDLAHLYSLSYYPKANPNNGWRAVTVRLVGDRLKKYKVRTRNGYRPQPTRFSGADKSTLSALTP